MSSHGAFTVENGTLRYCCHFRCAALAPNQPLYEEDDCNCKPDYQIVKLPMPPVDTTIQRGEIAPLPKATTR